MSLYKTTEEIFSNPWDISIKVASVANYPMSTPWESTKIPRIEDIELWEQISYTPGSIGIYVAHNPMCELYIITNDLYLRKDLVEVYHGNDAVNYVYERAKELGIEIKLKKVWKN